MTRVERMRRIAESIALAGIGMGLGVGNLVGPSTSAVLGLLCVVASIWVGRLPGEEAS